MTRRGREDYYITAGELERRLADDPEFQARMAIKEKAWQERAARNSRDAAPLEAEVRSVGLRSDSVDDLFNSSIGYRAAVPVLIDWLPRMSNRDVKEAVIRALSVPWARPLATEPLVRELYRTEDENLRWVIGNALSVVADDRVYEDLVHVFDDRSYGRARGMVAEALGRMEKNRQGASALLVGSLDDEEVVADALQALGKLRAVETLPVVEPFLHDRRLHVRSAARRALRSLTRAKSAQGAGEADDPDDGAPAASLVEVSPPLNHRAVPGPGGRTGTADGARDICAGRSDVGADRRKDGAYLGTQEDQGGDGDNGDEREHERVLRQPLSVLSLGLR